MSLSTMSNFMNQKSSLCPTNARQSVGDGAASFDTSVPSVLAVCHIEGNDNMYYYSTTFSGGPGKAHIPSFAPYPLAVPSGAFDAPTTKCPPDRGSSDCVTGSPASHFSSSPTSISSSPTTFSTSPTSVLGTRAFTRSIAYSPTTAAPITTIDFTHARIQQPRQVNDRALTPANSSTPRDIPAPTRSVSSSSSSGSSTPPLTPDGGSCCSGGSLDSVLFESGTHANSDPSSQKMNSGAESKDGLDFLMTLFPKDGLKALPYSKSVSISAPTLGAEFKGVVLEFPGKPKTLYVDGKSAASVSLRESIVALLDLASENLGCNALVIVLERSAPNLSELLHSLMYVGGSVVTKPFFPVNRGFVLVGLDM